jgi:hypothetical protein
MSVETQKCSFFNADMSRGKNLSSDCITQTMKDVNVYFLFTVAIQVSYTSELWELFGATNIFRFPDHGG